jgi:two-component system response regulator PrrA
MNVADSGRVLVVEDDDAVRAAVDRGLRVHGFDVSAVPDAEVALTAVAKRRPDVMIVDVGLPGMSGIDLCTRLRELSVETPILILAARLHALLRRARPAASATSVLAAGPLWLDVDRRVATVGGVRLELSRREFDLLAAFAANPGIVLSRIRLLELVWGYDFDVDTNVVDVFVGYLRRKLEAAGDQRLIDTVRGVGFVLRVS